MARIAFLMVALVVTLAGYAQAPYPSKPLSMIVPFPPGGVADITARPAAAAIQKILGQPVVVLNRPGAGGAVGMAAAATATPDGYTIMTALSSISIIPSAERLYGRKPPYELKQFAPIALLTADPTVLVVSASSPWRTLADFVQFAKQNPGKIAYGSSGNYGTLHVAMEMLAHAAGVKLHHVPYTGAGPALTSLLGGHVQAMASGPSVVIGNIKGGKLRPLAVWGAKRIESLPEVPTFKELGYDIEFYIWSGLFAPAGTPEPILSKLRETAKQVAQDPDFRAAMAKAETPVAYLDAPQFQQFWDRDARLLEQAIQRIGKLEEGAK
jgi:tripartite-type tricarboxylate transporter receptor subunit TctC